MLPRRYRFILAAAGLFLPRPVRREWRRQRERELWHWRAFLLERGGFSPDAETEMVRHCWRALGDAAGEWLHPARLLGSPGFCLSALAAFALLVGLATGGLRATRAALGPLPYPEPRRIVVLAEAGGHGVAYAPVPLWQFVVWRREVQSFESLAAYSTELKAGAMRVAPEFFAVLGVSPALGRLFQPGDKRGAVISYALWESRFGRDPGALGRDILVGGVPHPVLGILPPEFWFLLREVEVWTPLGNPPEYLAAVGRLRPGVDRARAEAEMRTVVWKHEPPRGMAVNPSISVPQERMADPVPLYRNVFLLFSVPPLALALLRRLFLRSPTRYELFFAAKTLLLLAPLAGLCLEFACAGSVNILGRPAWDRTVLGLAGLVVSTTLALVWCLRDQRRRCRGCLHPLRVPVTFGTHASWFLDPAGVELVCDRGHGTLYVPETHSSAQKPENWTALDETWRDLFDSAEK